MIANCAATYVLYVRHYPYALLSIAHHSLLTIATFWPVGVEKDPRILAGERQPWLTVPVVLEDLILARAAVPNFLVNRHRRDIVCGIRTKS